MCCSSPPPPPDLGPTADASIEIAEMARQTGIEQLEWSREQDTMNRATLDRVLEIQLPAMRDQFENARADRSRWEDVFRPMEDEFAQYAKDFDTPERRADERAKAISDVSTQFDASRRNALQRLEGYGVDPSQTRNSAMDIGVRTAQAAAQAGAGSASDKYIEQHGEQLRGQAIQLGRGVVGGVGGQYAGAVGAGQAAVGGSNQTTATSSNAINSSMGWGGQALGGYGQGANIMTQGYNNEMSGYNAQNAQTAGMLQGFGSIAGAAMAIKHGGYIDRKYAHGGAAIDPNVIEGEFEDITAQVEGPGGPMDDEIPAMLSDGEYVIPADVVRAKGEEFFDRLLEQYHDGPSPDSLKIERMAA